MAHIVVGPPDEAGQPFRWQIAQELTACGPGLKKQLYTFPKLITKMINVTQTKNIPNVNLIACEMASQLNISAMSLMMPQGSPSDEVVDKKKYKCSQ